MAKKMKSISGTVARQGIVSILLVLVVQVNGNQFFKTFAKGKVRVSYHSFSIALV